MTESGSQDRWKSIADLLGAPTSAEPEPPRPAPQVPAERPKKEKEAKPPAPKRKNHWGFVLSAVGLEAQPDEEQCEPVSEVAPQEVTPKMPLAEAVPRETTPPANWSNSLDMARDAIEDDPLVMPTESVFDEVASPILTDDVEMAEVDQEESESADSEEPRRRRRRRRRGRRRREEGAGAEESAPATPGVEVVADAVTDIAEGDEAEWTTEETSQPQTERESEDRPRRRRRRRRGRRDRDDARSETSTASAPSEVAESSPEDDEPDLVLHDDHEDSDDAGDAGDGGADLPTHRKIPTWREAIAMLVDTNLANHAKTKPFRGGGGGRRRPN